MRNMGMGRQQGEYATGQRVRGVALLLLLVLFGTLGAVAPATTTMEAAAPPPSTSVVEKPKPHAHVRPDDTAGVVTPQPRVVTSRVDTSIGYVVTVNTDTVNDANCQPAGAGDCTLRQAINAANANDPGTGVNRITFAANVTVAIVLNQTFGTLIVTAFPVQITGPGQTALAIDGGCTAMCGTATPTGGVAVLETDPTTMPALTLSGLTIRNGSVTSPISPSISAGLTTYGPVTLTDVTVSGNSTLGAQGYGGGLLATHRGLPSSSPIATLTNVTATGNYAGSFAGGMEIDDLGQTVGGVGTLTNLVATGNTSGNDAGGIGIENVSTITGLTATNNTAVRDAGGIEIDDVVTITNLTATGNRATRDGGGIYFDYLLTLTGATISGNMAGRDGGGVFSDDDNVFTNVTITNNTATGDGGGYYGDNYRRNNRVFLGLTITGNTAGGDGGGFFDQFVTVVVNATIARNIATGDGGGIYIESTPVIRASYGGPATLTLDASTVSDNTANRGGGVATGVVAAPPVSATLNDTLVAGNHLAGTTPIGPDLYNSGGDTLTGTYNIIGDGTGQGGTGGTITNGANNNRVGTTAAPINPLLAPLGTYGATNGARPSPCCPVPPPLIPAPAPPTPRNRSRRRSTTTTTTATVTTDARGIARPQGTACGCGRV